MNDIIPYQEVKLESQSVDEIWEDVEVLTNLISFSRYERARRLTYLKEECKHGEYLDKLKELGISSQEASEDTRFYARYSNKFPQWGSLKLKRSKVRALLELSNEDERYLDEIPDIDKVTAKQLREEIEKLKQEKEQERLAKEVVIQNNQQLQDQLEKEQKTKKVEYRTNEVEVPPNDYDELKYKASQYDEERKKNIELGKKIGEVQNEKTNIRYEYENKMRDIQRKYDEIKRSLEEMDLEEEKLYKYVRQDKELGQFVGDVQVLLLDRLATFNYSAYLDDDVNKYNVDMLAKLINQIRRWCNDMENMIEKYTEEFEEQENKDDGNIIEIENVEVE